MQRVKPAPRRRSASLRLSLALSLGPLLLAAGIAFLSSPTYAARAVVLLKPRTERARNALESQGETGTARVLREALRQTSELEALTGGASAPDPAPLEVVQRGIDVVPAGGSSYAVEFRGRAPNRVQRLTNELARILVGRAAADLGISPDLAVPESDLERRTSELAAFVAAHPELALDTSGPNAAEQLPPDAATRALRDEQARLEQALAAARARAGPESDNPYADPAPSIDDLRERLRHVRAALAARERKPKQPLGASSTPPEILAEWQRLIKAVAAARGREPSVQKAAGNVPALTARLVSAAALPASPERPNRPLLLTLGAMLSAGLSVLWIWKAGAFRFRPMRRGTVRQLAPRNLEPARAATAPSQNAAVAGPSDGFEAVTPPARAGADPRDPAGQPRTTFPATEPTQTEVIRSSSGWAPSFARTGLGSLESARDELLARALDQAPGGCFVVMITSAPAARAAKSETAAKLALALSEAGNARILLVEGDFDRPSVHRMLGVDVPSVAGFSQQMHERLHGTVRRAWTIVECLATLHVLAEGRVRSPGLLNTFEFESAVRELARHYELVVIDAPPISMTTDMLALEDVVDGVILVDQAGARASARDQLLFFRDKPFRTVTVS